MAAMLACSVGSGLRVLRMDVLQEGSALGRACHPEQSSSFVPKTAEDCRSVVAGILTDHHMGL